MNIFDKIITMSLEEDAPNGDITTIATVSPDAVISGRFVAKADGIICGLEIIGRTFEICGGGFELETYFKDGEAVRKGDIIARVKGNAQTILTGERTALNLIQRASGIATLTAAAVAQIKGTSAKICDTRKTMPGLRVLDKYAVRAGGGSNHRFCLSDGILIKDNHIKAAGSITEAVTRAKAYAPHTIKVEVEVETIGELKEALAAKADIINSLCHPSILNKFFHILHGFCIHAFEDVCAFLFIPAVLMTLHALDFFFFIGIDVRRKFFLAVVIFILFHEKSDSDLVFEDICLHNSCHAVRRLDFFADVRDASAKFHVNVVFIFQTAHQSAADS